ncbi:hypothetical protein [Campylobacter vicugnae]|uniref:hypothetical protein n=1 Tax=Campylobacter vicugnae TaxID=1660076 RepID=UPI0015D8AA12|nr:hypothetical protein [Campylobacter sp. RM9262]
MDTILLAFIFIAFNVLTVLCVVAIIVATLIDYGKPKGDKNGNRRDTERTKRNSWRFW